MQKWEYKTVHGFTGAADEPEISKTLDSFLNQLGKEGWEAVGFHREKPDFYGKRPTTVLMKRRIV